MGRPIKVLRGLKKDLPRLENGEFATTLDTREVFIGNSGENLAIATKEDLETKANDYFIDVLKFGAKGDNLQDDLPFINAAIKYAVLLKSKGYFPTLFFPRSNGYKTTNTVVIPSGISVIMDSAIQYQGDKGNTAIVIGDGSTNPRLVLKILVNQPNLSDWANENNIGVKIINAYESDITIVQASRFTIGVQFFGDGKGFVYNEVTLFSLNANKIAVDLNSNNGGWTNENNFYGGRFSVSSGQNNGKSRYGVRITSGDGYYQNSNLFIKPSFELFQANAGNGIALPILIEFGNLNTFMSCRHEGNNQIIIRTLNDSSENEVSTGFAGTTTVDDQSNFPSTVFKHMRSSLTQNSMNALFSITNIHKKACFYDTDTIYVPDLHLASSSNSGIFKNSTSISIENNYLSIPSTRGVGVIIDTSIIKQFVVRKDVLEDYGGRINIRCYDADMNVLFPTDKALVKGRPSGVPFWADNIFGGTYRQGTDSVADYYFKVDDSVKNIALIISGGNNPCYLKGFSISTIATKFSSVRSGIAEYNVSSNNLGIAAPTKGTWEKGRYVVNDNKTELGATGSKYIIEGWECIQSGTPGTWVAKRISTGN